MSPSNLEPKKLCLVTFKSQQINQRWNLLRCKSCNFRVHFSSSTLVHWSPFWRQKERSEHFWAQKQFCRAQKIEFIWGPKNTIFSKPKALQELPQISHHFGQKMGITVFWLTTLSKVVYCILVLWSPIMSSTVHDYSLWLFCHFLRSHPRVALKGHPGSAWKIFYTWAIVWKIKISPLICFTSRLR